MRVSRLICSLLLAVAMLVAASIVFPAAPAGKVLRFRPKEGDTAAYQFSTSTRGEMKEEAGQKSRMETSAQARCTVQFLGETAVGDFGAEAAIEPHTINETVDGEDQSKESPGTAARYVVNNQGRIKRVTWLTGDPSADPESAGLAATPDEVFLLGGAAILPDKPVKKGDKWSGTVTIPGVVMGGDLKVNYQSVLLGEEQFRGAACQKIKTTATATFAASEDLPEVGGTVKVSAKQTGQYTWLFDAERGLIASAQGTERVSVTAQLSDPDQTLVSFALSAVSNVRSTLTEYNGVSLAAK
ncbi:MAG: hypothetical protein ACE149_05130 [Armatimonadota bacterium]